jgi:hypothetical protein
MSTHHSNALTWLERNLPGGIVWVARALASTAADAPSALAPVEGPVERELREALETIRGEIELRGDEPDAVILGSIRALANQALAVPRAETKK